MGGRLGQTNWMHGQSPEVMSQSLLLVHGLPDIAQPEGQGGLPGQHRVRLGSPQKQAQPPGEPPSGIGRQELLMQISPAAQQLAPQTVSPAAQPHRPAGGTEPGKQVAPAGQQSSPHATGRSELGSHWQLPLTQKRLLAQHSVPHGVGKAGSRQPARQVPATHTFPRAQHTLPHLKSPGAQPQPPSASQPQSQQFMPQMNRVPSGQQMPGGGE